MLELGVASLDGPRPWLLRIGTGGASAAAAAKFCELWDSVLEWAGGEGVPVKRDGEVGDRTDLGRPGPPEPDEVEAFLAKGLLRTDMGRSWSEARK